jgi:hypothetical protein
MPDRFAQRLFLVGVYALSIVTVLADIFIWRP